MPSHSQLLSDLEAKLKAATPGPVQFKEDFGDNWRVQNESGQTVFDDGSACGEYNNECSEIDRDFIIALYNAAPLLLRLARAGERAINYLEHTEDLPEEGLKKNVKAAIAKYHKDVEGE